MYIHLGLDMNHSLATYILIHITPSLYTSKHTKILVIFRIEYNKAWNNPKVSNRPALSEPVLWGICWSCTIRVGRVIQGDSHIFWCLWLHYNVPLQPRTQGERKHQLRWKAGWQKCMVRNVYTIVATMFRLIVNFNHNQQTTESRIYWSYKQGNTILELKNTPFTVGDSQHLQCQYGPQYYKPKLKEGKQLHMQSTLSQKTTSIYIIYMVLHSTEDNTHIYQIYGTWNWRRPSLLIEKCGLVSLCYALFEDNTHKH